MIAVVSIVGFAGTLIGEMGVYITANYLKTFEMFCGSKPFL